MIKQKGAVEQRNDSDIAEPIVYGLARKSDIDAAARIYIENFPRRARELFQDECHVRNFYRDYMELMRLAHGKTFYVAREKDQLLGYLILVLPGVVLFPAVVREGFFLTAATHLFARRYSLSRSLIARILKALFSLRDGEFVEELSSIPHVSVLAVDSKCTGRGVGSGIMENLKNAWRSEFDSVSLCVDVDNEAAIRFYETMGFSIVKSSSSQHLMICALGTM